MAGCRPRSRSSPENRVRLTVEVPSHDVQHAVEHAAVRSRAERQDPRLPQGQGAEPGARSSSVGKERLMTEAIESHIGGWFWNAAARRRVRPSRSRSTTSSCPAPTTRTGSSPRRSPCRRSPSSRTGRQLEVGAIEPEVPEELVQQELDALRATVAELVPVEGRPVGPDDTVVVDLVSPRARPGATTSSSSAAAPSSRRSSRASSA